MTKRTCLRCGSDRIIPNVPLSDKFGEWGGLSGAVEVKVHGNPGAWLFKETEAGQLVAFICGSCGHTELKAQGFAKLYRKYRESLRRAAGEEAQPLQDHTGELFVCLSCGQSIPEDESRCPKCGWTWQDATEE